MTTLTPTRTLADHLKRQAVLINQHMETLFPDDDNALQSELFDAARYATLGDGKRIRPILTLETVEMLGADTAKALNPACALEMIHASSLIHDDLPCMDDDDFRRGKPTVHKQYGEACAVLVGDYLLTYAFEVIAQTEGITDSQRVQLITALSRATGSHGMVGGQLMDLAAETRQVSLEELEWIHAHKTGSLIACCLQFGGIIAGASADQLNTLERFGQAIGLAFQVVDDILDVTNSEAKHGKAVASDVANHKSTYVTLMGIEGAQREADRLWQLANETLNELPGDHTILEELATLVVKRTS